MIGAASTTRDLVLTRIFNAPRERVFKAWTDPETAKLWWGPVHHPATFIEMDVRVGGAWNAALRSVETGKVLTHRGVFRDVVPPKLLSFTFAWDEDGERGLETLVTLTFEDIGNDKSGDGKTGVKTRMTLRQTPFQSVTEQEGHGEGWSSTFDRLDQYLLELNEEN